MFAGPGHWIGWLGRTMAIFGVAFESFRYWRMLRRRLRLGLADPVVTNRFLLWAVWAACSTLNFVADLASRALYRLVFGTIEPVPEYLAGDGRADHRGHDGARRGLGRDALPDLLPDAGLPALGRVARGGCTGGLRARVPRTRRGDWTRVQILIDCGPMPARCRCPARSTRAPPSSRRRSELFAARGLHDVTMAEVAEAAGVARATVFNQFGSKHALVDAITAEVLGGYVLLLDGALADRTDADARARAHALRVDGPRHRGERALLPAIFREIAKVSLGLDEGGEAQQKRQRRARPLLPAATRAGRRAASSCARSRAEDLASAFDGLVFGTIIHWLYEDPRRAAARAHAACRGAAARRHRDAAARAEYPGRRRCCSPVAATPGRRARARAPAAARRRRA